MRFRIRRQALRSALRWSQRLLAAGAILALGYCALVLVDGWAYQKAERRQLDQLLESRPVSAASVPVPVTPMVQAGGLIGRLDIARLNISVIVVEGVGGRVLRHAAGHIPGTVLPGNIGNVGISAHRDTFFRPLRNIRQNDLITVTTPLGEYRYRVLSTTIVGPDDVTVLRATGGENLTLVTCYPFYFVGPAPRRFIVRAERIT